MKKILQVANGFALIATVLINYLSNTGIFNGNTMKSVSDKYHNYFTPAGYAFSIWGIIYLGLLGFVIYTGSSLFKRNSNQVNSEDGVVLKIGWWFVISCVGNSLWVVAWLYEYLGISVIIMIIVLFSLLKIIVNTRMELDFHPLKNYLFIYWPFAIYAGWISVALIADIAAWLSKINWEGFGVSQISWTIIVIIVAGLINVYMIWKRNLREYGLVGIWALVAIAVSNWNGEKSIVYSSIIVAAVIFINITMHALKNKNRNSTSM
ncbi:MAG: hypothetical protein ABIP68_02065 [Ferruginibacter sp.]